jgi:plasmid stability protein
MREPFTIENFPPELRTFWKEEADRHGRSIHAEVLVLLENERAHRIAARQPKKNLDEILSAARILQSLPVIDDRELNEILYDKDGLPR